MINILNQFINTVWMAFTGVLGSVLPDTLSFYNTMNGIKEQIIAAGLGVPVVVVAILSTAVTTINLLRKVFEKS